MTQESNGDYLFTQTASSVADSNDIGYVETISPTGTVLSTFGSSHIEGNDTHTGSGTQFDHPGQAAVGPSGTIYTADPLSTIEATSPNGYLQGQHRPWAAPSTWGRPPCISRGRPSSSRAGRPSTTAATTSRSSPSRMWRTTSRPSRSPTTPSVWALPSHPGGGQLFRPGPDGRRRRQLRPVVVVTQDASHLDLDYSIENQSTLTDETVPTPTDLAWPVDVDLGPLFGAPHGAESHQAPGPYLVQASLYDTSTDPPTLLGATCMPYTVGATGDQLNLAGLPSGVGSGGPADPRGVALNAELGLNGLRALSFSWSNSCPTATRGRPPPPPAGQRP